MTRATIAELTARLADGTLTAETLLETSLAKIAADERSGAGLSAFLTLNPQAEQDARLLDDAFRRAGALCGPLHGIPVVIKDNIDMAGLPTTSGCRALAHAMPHRDAEQVRRLRAAGAVIVGKTNMSEFSFDIRSRSSLGGDVRNPFNRTVTAGGSSGGTAASVAAGYATAGLGTDTGGSIRIPAAFNGLVGLRPTHGLVDLRGTAPLAPSTDTIGPIGRCVADVATLFGVMTDAPAMTQARALRGARIGVLRQAFGNDTEIRTAIEAALGIMAAAGATVVDPVELPTDALPTGGPHVVDWEFGPSFDAYLKANFVPGTAPASLVALYETGAYLPEFQEMLARHSAVINLDSAVYRTIMDNHRALRRALLAMLDAHALDALIYPTSAAIPMSLDKPLGGWAPELAACSGFPALTLPVGRAANLVPIGLEFLGRHFAEPHLLRLAGDFEEAMVFYRGSGNTRK
jgi:Asp-tRNA(Asn)/Glu-tRNA(Gln) amidotransferase A subunit family amidase